MSHSSEDSGSAPHHHEAPSKKEEAGVFLEGWLKKKTSWGRWKSNFFILTLTSLTEYKQKESTKPVAALPLEKVIFSESESVTGKKLSFSLLTPTGELWFLVAENQESYQLWKDAILEICGNQKNIYENSVEAFNDAVVISDEKGKITNFNSAAEKLFGWSKSEIIGENVSRLMPSSLAVVHHKLMEKYIETGEKHLIGKQRKLRASRKDGSEFLVNVSIGEMFEGTTRKFIATMRDLSFLNENKDDLAKSLDEAVKQTMNTLRKTLDGQLEKILDQNQEMRLRLSEYEKEKALLNRELLQIKAINDSCAFLCQRMPQKNFILQHMKELIATEVGKTSSSEILFRQDNSITDALGHFFRAMGHRYLIAIFEQPFKSIGSFEGSFEVNPGLIEGDASRRGKNLNNLLDYCDKFIMSITKPKSPFPDELSKLLRYMNKRIEKKFQKQQSKNTPSLAVGLVFLRFYCPYILNPTKFGLIEYMPTPNILRGLVLISKTLQVLATGIRHKEPYLTEVNKFIDEKQNGVFDYFEEALAKKKAN